jgi:hypothetical protein
MNDEYLTITKRESLFRNNDWSARMEWWLTLHYADGTSDFFEKYSTKRAAMEDAKRYFPGRKVRKQ